MSKHEKILYRKRTWLNRPGHHSIGLVHAEVTREPGHGWVDGYMTIGDCSRTITLSLGYCGKTELANSIFKLDTLMATIQGTRDALLKAQELADKEEEVKKKPKVKTVSLKEAAAQLGFSVPK